MAYHVHMSAEDARTQTQHGGTLLLLDAPQSLVFGVDQTGAAQLLQYHHECWHSEHVRRPDKRTRRPRMLLVCGWAVVQRLQRRLWHFVCPLAISRAIMRPGIDEQRSDTSSVQSFVTGDKFQGVKMIPSGPHIFTTTLISRRSPHANCFALVDCACGNGDGCSLARGHRPLHHIS